MASSLAPIRPRGERQAAAPPANDAGVQEPLVSVRIAQPYGALGGYITFFYRVEARGLLTDFLYPEWGNVRFRLSGDGRVEMPGCYAPDPQSAALFGPTDRRGQIVSSGGVTIGFGLTPLGWTRLMDVSAGAMANRVSPLGDALGCDGERVRDDLTAAGTFEDGVALLEALILGRLARRSALRPEVLAADRALRARPAEVATFAAQAGLRPRTLQRLCVRTFGFAPKRLLRLQRFLDTLGRVRSAVGGSIREELGEAYYDQAHFYRDFRDFMGMTPRAYFSAPRLVMAEAAAAQARAGVTLSFQLPAGPLAVTLP